MSRKTLASLLLALAIVFLVLGLATLLPSHASIISDLGYYTLCPFAPWSTLALLLLAGITWAVYSHVRSLK